MKNQKKEGSRGTRETQRSEAGPETRGSEGSASTHGIKKTKMPSSIHGEKEESDAERNFKEMIDENSNHHLEDKWGRIKSSYREKYPTVTEEDVTYREGEFDDMTQRVGERTNRSRDQIRNEIRDWEDESY